MPSSVPTETSTPEAASNHLRSISTPWRDRERGKDSLGLIRQSAFIPDEIICVSCQIPKGLAAFSNRQKELYKRTCGQHSIVCSGCNGAQKQEQQCTGCDKALPLSKFARSQRQDKDSVECLDCVAKRTMKILPDDHHEQNPDQLLLTEHGEKKRAGYWQTARSRTLKRGDPALTDDYDRSWVTYDESLELVEGLDDNDDCSDVSIESSDSEGSVFSV